MDHNLKIKCKTIKLLEDNIGENLDDLGNGNCFVEMMRAQSTREAIGKLDFIKIKNLCSIKDNVKIMRAQATDWEKIFAKDSSDKEFLSKKCKEPLKLNSKKINRLKKIMDQKP